MQEKRFATWLENVRGLSKPTIGSRLSNCRRVEKFEGDLDTHYAADGLAGLMDRLTFSREDERYGRKVRHGVPIDGDVCNGTATLRQAVKLYREFRRSSNVEEAEVTHAPALKQEPSARRTDGSWPQWPEPSGEALLELARVLAPLVRFLEPEIVGAIAEDNRQRRDEWSPVLHALGIDPVIYLWEGSACAFPGVRRHAGGKEIAEFRGQAESDEPPSQCLALDDNDYPKHLWSFVFTGKPFRKRGPDGYQMAHLFDHKAHGNRWREELNLAEAAAGEPAALHGLFTSAANTVYLPASFLRPTDFSSTLRSLMQRRALALYGGVCRMVPPPLIVKSCDDPKWSVDAFRWSAPEGDLSNVPAFLEFRRARLGELIGKRFAATPIHGRGLGRED